MRTKLLLRMAVILALMPAGKALAADWPTYMHDNARSGVTAERLELPLVEQWVYEAPAAPQPAWPDPQSDFNELPKVKIDDALYTVAVGSNVYFGSSVDNQVYALDAATGAIRWRFFTGAPVRLAPTVSQGRVYVGSDDGRVYCLAAGDGRLLWEHDAAPESRRVIGNGRVISLWPVRTGVLVEGDRAYFGSGIFPYHAPTNATPIVQLNAETGALIPWKGPAVPAWRWNDVSPQGYLLWCHRGLVVPCGRVMPAVVDGESGARPYTLKARDKKSGGTYVAVVDKVLHVGMQNTLYAYDAETGNALSQWTPVRQLIATPETYFTLLGRPTPAAGPPAANVERDTLTAVDRASRDQATRKDGAVKQAGTRWVYKHPDLMAMILVGDRVVAGCRDEVTLVDALDGKELWKARVKGDAVGLTVAGGRLLVSTTRGAIHCFAPTPPPARAMQPPAVVAWPAEPSAAVVGQAAEGLVRESGVRRGYALVMGAGAVRLACELAKRTELVITCVESDPAQLLAARQRIATAGLYGHRITVEAGNPERLPYPDYAANLVVHAGAPVEQAPAAKELLRVLKPCGGVLLLGPLPGTAQWAAPAAEAVRLWETAGVVSRDVPVLPGGAPWTSLVRGELEGSGWWTHCYADEGNTGASADKRVRGKLGVLWFGAPGADEAPERHTRSVSPLVMNGRVFYQGWRFAEHKSILIAFDAYNGLRYWERDIPGAVRLGMPAFSGNLACSTDSLFVAAGSTCHRLDAATGVTRATYETPPATDGTHAAWGYVAVANGLLFGSTINTGSQAKQFHDGRWTQLFGASANGSRFSEAVFAIDLASGKQLWVYRGKEIRDSTVAIWKDRLFFVENRGPPTPPAPLVARAAKAEVADDEAGHDESGKALSRTGAAVRKTAAPPLLRTVVALVTATGKPAWEQEVDLTGCGIWEAQPDPLQAPGFSELQALCKDDILLLAAAYHKHDKAPEDAVQRRALALSTRDGSTLWSESVGNLNRPIIVADLLLAGPLVRQFRTGGILRRPDPRTGKEDPWSLNFGGACGAPSACEAFVFFRGGSTMWRNVRGGSDGLFIGVRPGCFINVIPAGGVVVQPEASSGCTCIHAIQCTVVFSPREAE